MSRRGKPPPLPEPTTALPGTPEKVEVLAERARRRQQLFHPLDARAPGKAPHGNVRSVEGRSGGRTGFVRHKLRYRARVWCPRLKAQIDLGLFITPEAAATAVVRARGLLGTE